MAIKFLSSLDLGGSQITDFALENRTANPTSPTTGQVYYHTTDDQVKIYNGSAWDVVGLEYTAGDGISLSGTAFSVAGGDGLTQESSGLKVDTTVVRTSGVQSIGGNKTFGNNVTITGNLTVNGTNTILNTAELAVEDVNITLNSGAEAGADSGISVNRGDSAFVPIFQWDESAARWQFTNDGTAYHSLAENAADGANAYSLPTASSSTKGGVKIGSRITIASGVISADVQTANDFTNTLKTKLDGVAASADAYGSWTASDGTTSETIGSGAQVNFEGANATSVTYTAATNTFEISSDDTNTTYSVGDNGLTAKNFTAVLKTKLDGIEAGAKADQDLSGLVSATDVAFTVDGNDVIVGDDLVLAGGLSWTNSTKTLTSANTNTTYSIQDGELSQNNFTNADHTKLNGIETSATADQSASEIRTALGTGNSNLVPSIGTAGHFLKHDGTFGAPSYTTDTNRSDASVYGLFSGGSNITLSASGVIAGTANTQLSDSYVRGLFSGGSNITLAADGTIAGTANTQLSTEQVQDIIGAMVASNTETNITVTYNDTTGKLNFVATDTNTTYSAGVGLTNSGTEFRSATSSYVNSFTAVTSIAVAQTSHRCAFPASISLYDVDGNFVLADITMEPSTGDVAVSGLPSGNYHISIVGTRG
tara:strand:+ start:5297 stop:7252 length:1956 start_codon:yes stop_codon:yes gene_type:complete